MTQSNRMKRDPADVKVFVSSVLPDIGIDMLRRESFNVMTWDEDAPIPPDEVARIAVPTSLVWGRHDLATSLAVAETASARYGWPLYVIENAGDDPGLEQPEQFVEAVLRGGRAA